MSLEGVDDSEASGIGEQLEGFLLGGQAHGFFRLIFSIPNLILSLSMILR